MNKRKKYLIPQKYKKKVVTAYCEQLYTNKLDNLKEMDKFLAA